MINGNNKRKILLLAIFSLSAPMLVIGAQTRDLPRCFEYVDPLHPSITGDCRRDVIPFLVGDRYYVYSGAHIADFSDLTRCRYESAGGTYCFPLNGGGIFDLLGKQVGAMAPSGEFGHRFSYFADRIDSDFFFYYGGRTRFGRYHSPHNPYLVTNERFAEGGGIYDFKEDRWITVSERGSVPPPPKSGVYYLPHEPNPRPINGYTYALTPIGNTKVEFALSYKQFGKPKVCCKCMFDVPRHGDKTVTLDWVTVRCSSDDQ